MMKVRAMTQMEFRVKELMLTGCRRVGVALVFRLIIANIHLFLTQVISGMCLAPWNQGSRRCSLRHWFRILALTRLTLSWR